MSRTNRIDATAMQNAIKTLLTNIRFSSIDKPIKSLVVTSTVPNEGKSTIAVNLAHSIAQSGKSVLLIECDMRRRSLANILGVHGASGVYSVLSGQSNLNDAVVATRTRGMYFLDSEPHIPNPVDIIGSKRFSSLIDKARETYDYIVVDTPPVGAFVDAALASRAVDGTIVVLREKFTRRQEAKAALEQLNKIGANVLGVVMNYCENNASEHYYEYYQKPARKNSIAASLAADDSTDFSTPAAGVEGQAPSTGSRPLPTRRGSSAVQAVSPATGTRFKR